MKRMLQVLISEDAFLRIKVRAAATGKRPGDVVSLLATEYLPPAPETSLPASASDQQNEQAGDSGPRSRTA